MVDYIENITDTERETIQSLIEKLTEHVDQLDREDNSSIIIRIGNSHELLEIPNGFFHSLKSIFDGISEKKSVSVEPYDKEITIEEAAKIFFHLAPHHVEELLDKGEISYRQKGNAKLMKLSEVLKYDKKLRIEGRKALDELTKISQEMGLYDMHDNPLVKK